MRSWRRRLADSPLRTLLRGPDEVVLAHSALGRVPSPGRCRVMVDVGAHRGSSLERFARSGWQVHAFEPDRINRAALLELARAYPRVHVDPRAVSCETGKRVPFYRSEVSSGISALAPFHPSHREVDRVETVTLEVYCAEKELDAIDFLKVDCEGHDLFVLQGVPWQRLRPAAVVCEFEDRKTRALGYGFRDLADFLAARGYAVLVSEWHPILEYGARHRWRRFASYPCALIDPCAWGNLIAFQDPAAFERLRRLADRAARTARLGAHIRRLSPPRTS